MKILLAPAETKKEGGDCTPYTKKNFFFQEFDETRDLVVKHYEKLLQNNSLEELSKWFGLKKLDEVKKYQESILQKPTMKAIERYTGVAFEALEYENLSETQQKYCDKNIILFSNLFGPLKADDLIPDYKFKQGAILPNIDVIKEYKKVIQMPLDHFIENEVIDLRAGFYDKFYKPTMPTITYKFLKDGKVVSHWAKFYRGNIVKQLAKNNIESFSELMSMELEGLKLLEITEQKNIKTLVMEITP
jgi:cytoplasmic iron level regulating protein YaaA (DUF328/UPF0246 family)